MTYRKRYKIVTITAPISMTLSDPEGHFRCTKYF